MRMRMSVCGICYHLRTARFDPIATESGRLMDFINARRFLESEYQMYMKDPEGYCGPPEPTDSASDDSYPDVDLPF